MTPGIVMMSNVASEDIEQFCWLKGVVRRTWTMQNPDGVTILGIFRDLLLRVKFIKIGTLQEVRVR